MRKSRVRNICIVLYSALFLFTAKKSNRKGEKSCHTKKQKSITTAVILSPCRPKISRAIDADISRSRKKKKHPTVRKPNLKQGTFPNEEHEKEFIESNIERKKINAAKRRVRLMRKVYLQEWNYFVTFTFSGELHTEETFKEKLRNTLKHMASRKGWKYIGVWERSPEKQRLHFHGIFYIPPNAMIGELVEVKDYSTKSHRMQTTFQNTHFQKHFGRNDFKELGRLEDVMQSVRYLLKYIEKNNERLIYGGKLPTYFVSDIIDEDIICPYGVDGRKAILFDNFTCIDEGCIVGQASEEVINQMPKCN